MATLSIQELKKVSIALEEALAEHDRQPEGKLKEMLRDSVIQRFEFCVELSYKVSLKHLGTGSLPPKPAVREMAQAGLIEDTDQWFDFIEARNKSSHTYDERVANDVLAIARDYPRCGSKLIQKLDR